MGEVMRKWEQSRQDFPRFLGSILDDEEIMESELYGIRQDMGTFATIEAYCKIRGVEYPRNLWRGKNPVQLDRLYRQLTSRWTVTLRIDDWSHFYLTSGEF
ncbi:hypothetical protein [Roseofilum casamattae]|uniref:Uncharacterized protein n=1 Tax=Roseofilum casamattae BLCC-M143 TaxID=3022442 RepID=A0ABT7C3D2_9CYAN|nr:hypothetical protein [Roseofilum casamattae]MDJ1185825.1 hypothetical protein [Roseofilum casamattae BLCC-M143]